MENKGKVMVKDALIGYIISCKFVIHNLLKSMNVNNPIIMCAFTNITEAIM